MDYHDKIKEYNSLVEQIKNCNKQVNCDCRINPNKKGVYLVGCDYCDEVNLWSYWEGGRDNLNADILLVGQDWGCLEYEKNVKNVIKERNDGKQCCYMEDNNSVTNIRLSELFSSIGFDIKTDTTDNTKLFFTNLVLCYRSKGLSGDFQNRWVSNCSDYFKKLVSIIEPKIILCLGRNTFEGVVSILGGKSNKKSYNKIIDSIKINGPVEATFSGRDYKIFPLAHCGSMGTNNRNKGKKKLNNILGYQIDDWKIITKYI